MFVNLLNYDSHKNNKLKEIADPINCNMNQFKSRLV